MKKNLIFYALLYVLFSTCSCLSMENENDTYIVQIPKGSTVRFQQIQTSHQFQEIAEEQEPSLPYKIAVGVYKAGCCLVTTAMSSAGAYYTVKAYQDNNQDEPTTVLAGFVAGSCLAALGYGAYVSGMVAANWFQQQKQTRHNQPTIHRLENV